MNTMLSGESPPQAGRFSRPTRGRRFAIGDVHGCCRTLCALVEEQIRLEQDDTLYLLGDYIDRGPDSKGVVEYLMRLWQADYDIRPLMGNHEEMLLQAAAGDNEARRLWFNNEGWATMRQFGAVTPADVPQRYLDFLAMLPRILITNDYVLVHAGLDFRTADPIRETSPHHLLWERDYQSDPAKLHGRTLVCGHSIMPLFAIREALTSQHICLDNGCFDKGHIGLGSLVALQLDTRELLVQQNCD